MEVRGSTSMVTVSASQGQNFKIFVTFRHYEAGLIMLKLQALSRVCTLEIPAVHVRL